MLTSLTTESRHRLADKRRRTQFFTRNGQVYFRSQGTTSIAPWMINPSLSRKAVERELLGLDFTRRRRVTS